jgi:hypothetical protein
MIRYEDLTGEEIAAPPEPVNPTPLQAQWLRDGAVILPWLIPDSLIDAYCEAWKRERLGLAGLYHVTPYRYVPELLDLCCYGPLSWALEDLIGEKMGVHLNLVGWESTERDWHADCYLNPPEVAPYYAAVWFALEGILPDAGPFEYVPGSHRWGQLDQAQVRALIPADERDLPSWPRSSETILTPVVEAKIAEAGAAVRQFLGERGDVLIWHSKLVHRGSRPNIQGLRRRALIAHYSGITRRPDMPDAIPHRKTTEDGEPIDGWQFPL